MSIPFFDLKQQYQAIQSELHKSIQDVFDSSYYVMGNQLKQFEQEFANYSGAQKAMGVASGTDAIYLALKALGIVLILKSLIFL